MITAFGHIESVVVAMKNGATDYLEKPFQHLEKLRISVSRALEEVKARREINRLQGLEEGKYRTSQIVGEAAPTRRLREVITQLAQSEAHTILVQGESGTGKELVARGLHYEQRPAQLALHGGQLRGHHRRRSSRASCSATRRAPSPTPSRRKKGLFELADGGTLFLDEVGEIPRGQPGQAAARACRSARSSAWAGPGTSRSTCA